MGTHNSDKHKEILEKNISDEHSTNFVLLHRFHQSI